jgi:hypothetical protein
MYLDMELKMHLPVKGYITQLRDSDRKQCYKEAESSSIACRGNATSATLAGRRGIGTGDIGRDGKVLRQCQVCALRELKKKMKLSHTSHNDSTICGEMSKQPEGLPDKGCHHLHRRPTES